MLKELVVAMFLIFLGMIAVVSFRSVMVLAKVAFNGRFRRRPQHEERGF
jgi:hypothetical protein